MLIRFIFIVQATPLGFAVYSMIIVLYKKIGPILLDKLVFECPAFHLVDINRLQLYDLSIIEMDKIIKERFFFFW